MRQTYERRRQIGENSRMLKWLAWVLARKSMLDYTPGRAAAMRQRCWLAKGQAARPALRRVRAGGSGDNVGPLAWRGAKKPVVGGASAQAALLRAHLSHGWLREPSRRRTEPELARARAQREGARRGLGWSLALASPVSLSMIGAPHGRGVAEIMPWLAIKWKFWNSRLEPHGAARIGGFALGQIPLKIELAEPRASLGGVGNRGGIRSAKIVDLFNKRCEGFLGRGAGCVNDAANGETVFKFDGACQSVASLRAGGKRPNRKQSPIDKVEALPCDSCENGGPEISAEASSRGGQGFCGVQPAVKGTVLEGGGKILGRGAR